jgi:putative ABC transport system permease protein
MLDRFALDVRHAARSLRQSRGFTTAVVLTLALGIGPTSAIFTLVNATLLKPVPYPAADRLVALAAPDGGAQTGQLFLFLRERMHVFDHLAAQRVSNGWNLVAGDVATYVTALRISEDYFDTLGVQPMLGRGFSRVEDQPGGPDAVVISEALWRRAYGGSTDALGQTILLGAVSHRVVGVMPAAFQSIPDAEVWTPLRTSATDNGQNYQIVGRLRAGTTPAQAAAEFGALRPSIQNAFARYSPRRLAATTWMPLRDVLGASLRQPLLMLLGAVSLLLLIACVNVAGLQLTRALGQRREIATRAALGSSRLRLVRHVAAESLLLSLGGAAAGVGVALASARFLPGLVSEAFARQMLAGGAPTVDWRVLAFTVLTALLCSLFFGVAPALMSSSVSLRHALGEALTTTDSWLSAWLRRALVGAQVALAGVLLVGAGLLVRSVGNLFATELGFSPRNVVVGRMSLQGSVTNGRELESLLYGGLASLRSVRGVVTAAASNGVPVERPINVAMDPPAGARVAEPRAIDWRYVTPDYFAVFGIPLVAGRSFDNRDRAGGSPVVIVNGALARSYFGRVNVVGETIGVASAFSDPPRRIVGVVNDVKARSYSGWTEGRAALGSATAPMAFVPAGQASTSLIGATHRSFPMTWAIASQRPLGELEADLRQAIRTVDPYLTFIGFEPMDAVIARDLDVQRFVTALLAVFAMLAVILAAIGLYGLMAYAASQRRREIALRMALGATATTILRRFMAEGLFVSGIGMVTGVAFALILTRILTVFLFGISPLDPATFATVTCLLLTIAALAIVVPAARAARTNVSLVLRAE